jgi:hypothetical protein
VGRGQNRDHQHHRRAPRHVTDRMSRRRLLRADPRPHHRTRQPPPPTARAGDEHSATFARSRCSRPCVSPDARWTCREHVGGRSATARDRRRFAGCAHRRSRPAAPAIAALPRRGGARRVHPVTGTAPRGRR